MEISLDDIELSYLRQENPEVVLEHLITYISQNTYCQQEEHLLYALVNGNKRIP